MLSFFSIEVKCFNDEINNSYEIILVGIDKGRFVCYNIYINREACNEKDITTYFFMGGVGNFAVFFQRLWDVKVRISEKKAKKIEADAKAYDKIVIHNGFNKRGKK